MEVQPSPSGPHIPSPVKKFHFLQKRWTQEQVHGVKAAQPPVIAHVCSEARNVALSNGSVKKIMIRGETKQSDKLGHVWVDSKRDTVVISLSRCIPSSGKLYKCRNNEHLYSLLSNRDMRIALDYSWVLAWHFKDPGRKLYYDWVHGLGDCDFVILDLQLDATDEEAASTGLFGGFGTTRSVLIPIEDTCQMSRLFDATNNFSTVDFMKRWENFTIFRRPTNLVEFIQRWEKLAAREVRNVQRGLDYFTDVQMGTQGKNAHELRKLAARNAEIRQSQPRLRPVIMVSRGADGSR
ncbi:hypothetical protein F5883DRAFT_640408 [Diaporthe sp. PMI_573]|nr:hypothetical protein F5883DRAFT_640408 [Diaporthaceae sp. PMI_573]